VILYLSRNAPLVGFVLLKAVSISQPWCVEDANLRKRLHAVITSANASTYHYAVAACKFVNACHAGLALVVRTPLLVAVVEDAEVVVINVIPSKDIGDEFQGGGLSNASLPKKEDGQRRFRLGFYCLDDSLFERHYVAKGGGQYYCIKDIFVAHCT